MRTDERAGPEAIGLEAQILRPYVG